MNTTTIVVGIAALIIGLGGGYVMTSNQQPAPMIHNMDTTMAGMTAILEDRQGAEFEQAFIDEMIVHHDGAVDMAKLLLAGTARPELVKLGNDIISAQTGEIKMMKGWRAEWFK